MTSRARSSAWWTRLTPTPRRASTVRPTGWSRTASSRCRKGPELQGRAELRPRLAPTNPERAQERGRFSAALLGRAVNDLAVVPLGLTVQELEHPVVGSVLLGALGVPGVRILAVEDDGQVVVVGITVHSVNMRRDEPRVAQPGLLGPHHLLQPVGHPWLDSHSRYRSVQVLSPSRSFLRWTCRRVAPRCSGEPFLRAGRLLASVRQLHKAPCHQPPKNPRTNSWLRLTTCSPIIVPPHLGSEPRRRSTSRILSPDGMLESVRNRRS